MIPFDPRLVPLRCPAKMDSSIHILISVAQRAGQKGSLTDLPWMNCGHIIADNFWWRLEEKFQSLVSPYSVPNEYAKLSVNRLLLPSYPALHSLLHYTMYVPYSLFVQRISRYHWNSREAVVLIRSYRYFCTIPQFPFSRRDATRRIVKKSPRTLRSVGTVLNVRSLLSYATFLYVATVVRSRLE